METIKELALRTVEAMLVYGLSHRTAWTDYGRTFQPLIRLHALHGKEEFDREIVTEYVRQYDEQFERGEIKTSYYRNVKRGIQRLTEMHDTGKLSWTAPKKKSGFHLNEYYEGLVSDFIANGDFSNKGRSDATWVSRKYFSWLIQDGHPDLRKTGADEVQRFMIYCSQHMSSTGVYDVKLYTKKLYVYLKENNHSAEDYAGLFAFSVMRESKLFPALSSEEIALILDEIDRRMPKGKRDYAIILLAVQLGLRAIDITKLKLTDIDWRRGEIKLVQAKTGVSVALPLTKDVGEAIKDYILHGRQDTESDALFLRIHAPFQAFADAVSIGDMYDYYRKRAGLPRDAYDGKGFHALRRTLGRNLVTSGSPVTMVAQILGQEDIDSTKKYIALDSEHLKECALDFTGIDPEGSMYHG